MERLEDRFNRAIERWKEHCYNKSHVSDPKIVLNCEAFEEIVSMGRDALPFIRDYYTNQKTDIIGPGRYLTYAIERIAGKDFQIDVKGYLPVKPVAPDFKGISLDDQKKYVLGWLDKQLS
ncbi:MAG: hypothetical protein WC867_05290 [Candidatus Pacearchaeota archaeon]|jgi:hypothetical protein